MYKKATSVFDNHVEDDSIVHSNMPAEHAFLLYKVALVIDAKFQELRMDLS